MPKHLTLQPHSSIEELKQHYCQALDPVERSHYQILWLLAQGKTTAQIQEVTGYSINWIRALIHRYNKWGIDGIRDRRHDNPGAETLLDDVLAAQLLQVLQSPPPDGGLWNGRYVLLTVDRASWHTTEQVVLPPGLHLELIPCYSLELQPAERLWPLTNEPIANRSFATLDELEETVFQRCRTLLKQRELIHGLTCFHWWPQVAA